MTPAQADEILARAVARTNQWIPDGAAIVWAEDLERIRFEDAKEALRSIGSRPLREGERREITPRDVIAEVHRIRERRVASFDIAQASPPSGMSVVEYIAWNRRQRELAADGKPLEATPALEARPTRDLIARLRRSIAVT